MSSHSTIAAFLVMSMLMPPLGLAAPTTTTSPNATLKTANYFLRAGFELDASRDALASYDLLILPAEAQVFNRDTLTALRQSNPDIVILAYVPTVSWNSIWSDDLHSGLAERITKNMWLTRQGERVSIWPGTSTLDLTGEWQNVLASYVANDILATDVWDGVMYDEVSDDIGWDTDRAEAWRDAYAKLFATTQQLAPEALILTNGSSSTSYQQTTDGRIFESFPTPWEQGGDWAAQVATMMENDRVDIINVNTNNTGIITPSDLRLGLAAALFTDAYFSVDYGTTSHGQLWTAPDFDGDIGRPQGAVMILPNGLWIRHFTDGDVFANPTNQPIIFDDGTSTTTVNAHDAVIVDNS
ncbi:MAG: putative glycoside hydrolase family 15 protein [Candidatus Uhrbacteria bacterium]|nr:putative glycoside hydrolase family 15 protein [Candidatus Uhrbacteria bacterium]